MRKPLLSASLTTLAASLLLAGQAAATEVAPYFYTWGYGNPVYPVTSLQDAKAKGIDSVTLAFIINGSSGCQATTDGSSNAITGVMKNDIAAYRQAGGKLILSFGGANGTYLEAACTVDQMVAQIDALIQSSGIKTLDFDVEGGAVGNTSLNSVRSAALKKLQSKYSDLKVSFTLAVAPPVTYSWGTDAGGLSAASLAVVDSAVKAGVKVSRVNLMAMDYGNYYTNGRTDLGQLAIDAATRVREQIRPVFAGYSEAQLWDLIGITPMIGINDVASEIFTVAHAQKVADFAKKNGVGLLSYWALQRDQAGKGELAIYSGVNSSDFQFWNIFKAVRSGVVVTPTVTPKPSATPTVAPTPKPSATPTATPTIKPTIAPSVTPTAVNNCKPWDATATYLGGECVSHNGQTFKAQWWTRGESPATNSGAAGSGKVWLPLGSITTPKPSVTPTVTVTPKPSVTPTVTVTPKPSVTPTVTVTPKPSVTPTVTVTPKPSVTPTVTVTPKPSVTPTVTVTPKPSVTPAVTATPKPSVTPTVIVTPIPGSTGKQVGSYFAQWGVYGRGYEVADVISSGTASQLTFINYAFGNLYPKNGGYECDIVNRMESGNADGGDAWADFGRTPSRRVDPADTIKWDDKLAGNFRELKALKAKYPNIRNYISLGGWTWSKWFSNAAATDALRKQLVASCINVYIKGNLPVIDGRGGAGAAAGVFDGIDIDWEFPGVQGVGYNTVSVQDGENYRLLLAEFRRQLDALGAQTGKRYGLTIALGVGKDKLDKINVGSYAPYLDWVNMMTYDFNGAWDLSMTDFQSHLYADPASPKYACSGKAGDVCYGNRSLVSFYNIHDAVTQLLAQGTPASKLVLGVPFYGRGWTGVTNANNGLYQKPAKAATGTYEAGIEDYKKLKNAPGTVYVHPTTKQSWKFDGSTFWSYDTPAVIQTKVDYIKAKGLAGIMSWELDGDTADGELAKAMGKVRQ
ncbi:glycosyl hydrolase family 18 protein [Chitinilyticum piscinae]|uniref:chitinase n=1 Tax=Chitinilyticum piscinae TaxID=2866724 RepID=A0A8J7K9L2_9NEIS|nr:glycosyl hydrolase family 18 protein [Chitinilyticum piscinae]MBE9608329.1 hypothetical protein [Chitinilyticum piscinae]